MSKLLLGLPTLDIRVYIEETKMVKTFLEKNSTKDSEFWSRYGVAYIDQGNYKSFLAICGKIETISQLDWFLGEKNTKKITKKELKKLILESFCKKDYILSFFYTQS